MTKQERKLHISNWELSGKSKASYCRETGIKYSQFISWFKQNLEESTESGRFLELPSESFPTLEIVLPNGVRLYINESLNSSILKMLSNV